MKLQACTPSCGLLCLLWNLKMPVVWVFEVYILNQSRLSAGSSVRQKGSWPVHHKLSPPSLWFTLYTKIWSVCHQICVLTLQFFSVHLNRSNLQISPMKLNSSYNTINAQAYSIQFWVPNKQTIGSDYLTWLTFWIGKVNWSLACWYTSGKTTLCHIPTYTWISWDNPNCDLSRDKCFSRELSQVILTYAYSELFISGS